MRKIGYALRVALLVTTLACTGCSKHKVEYQDGITDSPTTAYNVGHAVLATAFTPQQNYYIDNIQIALNVSQANDVLTLTIQSDATPAPGTIYASKSITAPGQGGWATFTLDSRLAVTSSTEYFIRVAGDANVGSEWNLADPSSYAYKRAVVDGTPIYSASFIFKIYGVIP
jgi:hypothetical protein